MTHPSTQPHAAGDRFAAAIRRRLDAEYVRPFSLKELAASLGRSPGYLLHAFSRKFGTPPRSYLIEVRIRRACELLDAGTPVKCVPQLVGFYDQAHLTRHFKRVVGETPARFAARRISAREVLG